MNYNRQNFIQAWEAFIAPTERISIEEAQGRKAASTIRQYPPGIPDIIPGMRYSQDVLDRIKFAHTSGVDIIGIDMTLRIIFVLDFAPHPISILHFTRATHCNHCRIP